MTFPNDPLMQLIMGFGLVVMRVGSFIMACPPFAPDILKGRFRAALTVSLSLALFLSLPHQINLPEYLLPAFLLEGFCGVTMAMVVRVAAVAIHYAGELIDMAVGFGFHHILNPLSQEMAGPLQMMSQVAGSLIFFVAGGQEQVILGLARSLRNVPPGHVPWRPAVAFNLAEEMGTMIESALRIAAPLLSAVIATLLCLAFLTRVAPQLNVWAIGFLITTGVVLVGLLWFIPSWVEQVAYLWQSQTALMMRDWTG